MVVDTPDTERADRLLHALADATRRDIVRRAIEGEHSVSALARAYPMSFAAVQKHVAVLERAGLVTKHRRGREILVRTDIESLRRASAVLDQLEAVWRERVARIDDLLALPSPSGQNPKGEP
jgi:DNA-binding transcriptional ArsR family regulator